MNQSMFFLFNFFLISLTSMILISACLMKLNPLSLLILLIFYSFWMALNLTKLNSFSLMTFILFLMMTGGMMVLFTFFLSLISNSFVFSKNSIFLLFSTMLLMFISIFIHWKFFYTENSFMNLNFNKLYSSIENQFLINEIFNLNNFLNFPKNYLNIFLIIYLLISVIFITKITSTNFKPLRSKKIYE